jgi:lipopolysaccharide cholinephosphotransferase
MPHGGFSMSSLDNLTYFISVEAPNAIDKPFENHEMYKPIDVAVAKENLDLFNYMANKKNLKFIVLFGTLLGIHRDKNLIPYDSDVDVAIRDYDVQTLIYTIKELKRKGFTIARYEKDSLVSIIRNDCYIDIYIFHKQETNYTLNIWDLEFKDFDGKTEVVLDGKPYKTVAEIEKTLCKFYGKDWMVPKKNFSAQCFKE